jgi:hypothetical protein
MNEKVLFGPKFGTLINRKGLQFSELLHFIKLQSSDKELEASGSRQDRSRGGSDSRAAGHLTCNQIPTYIRGSGPLD